MISNKFDFQSSNLILNLCVTYQMVWHHTMGCNVQTIFCERHFEKQQYIPQTDNNVKVAMYY